jgi:hypothetical protein
LGSHRLRRPDLVARWTGNRLLPLCGRRRDPSLYALEAATGKTRMLAEIAGAAFADLAWNPDN